MTSAVLYGTTSDNELRPVRVTDSGEFVTDGGGGGDWYANLYVGGSEGDPSISLTSNGTITSAGPVVIGTDDYGQYPLTRLGLDAKISSAGNGYILPFWRNADGTPTGVGANLGSSAVGEERIRQVFCEGMHATGDVYANNFIPADGFDVSKIGQALSTIHDVIESFDDLEGLKNLFLHLLDNLKSDPTPPEAL